MNPKIKAYLFYITMFVILFAGVSYASSFQVGVNMGNAPTATLVNEDGYSISSTHPLAVSSAPSIITTIADGRKSVTAGGTPEPLSATATAYKECAITGAQENTDVVVIGSATVDATKATRTGTPLLPLQTLTIQNADLSIIFVDAEVNGESVTFNCQN